jgi:hypothetical protein
MKVAALVAALAMVLAGGGSAMAAKGQAGTLTCKGGAGVGLILGSKKHYDCVFKPTKGPSEAYVGSVTQLGLDLGFTSKVTIVWAVFSSSNEVTPRALVGDYVGASADASFGVGVGTKVLVGGSKNTISLQPLSVQGQTGLNVAIGVADLSLR